MFPRLLYSAEPVLTRSHHQSRRLEATPKISPRPDRVPVEFASAVLSIRRSGVASVGSLSPGWISVRDLGARVARGDRAASSSHERGVRGLRAAVLRGLRLPLPQVHRRLRPRWREEEAEAVRDPVRRGGS
uniref:Vesicle transport v-SNARE 13 n=1 Tax=Arundo donax TaxID=35708 RepID=A0A0A9EYP7_ARUDO